MKFPFWGRKQNNSTITELKKKINRELIERAYEKRAGEIESLRKYDQGEKDIVAPDLRDIVHGV